MTASMQKKPITSFYKWLNSQMNTRWHLLSTDRYQNMKWNKKSICSLWRKMKRRLKLLRIQVRIYQNSSLRKLLISNQGFIKHQRMLQRYQLYQSLWSHQIQPSELILKVSTISRMKSYNSKTTFQKKWVKLQWWDRPKWQTFPLPVIWTFKQVIPGSSYNNNRGLPKSILDIWTKWTLCKLVQNSCRLSSKKIFSIKFN